MIPDWQLPVGVSRGLWEYVHDRDVARRYDERLGDAALLQLDLAFVRRHCPRPGRLIDLGCGTGRLSIDLARDGYRCVALDLSEEMLAVVAEKSAKAQVCVDRLKANLADLRALQPQTFDYAACLFQTLGMVAGGEQRRHVVDQVRRLLKPDGIFILHVHNRWFNIGTSHGRRLLLGDLWKSWIGRQEPGDYVMPPDQGIGPMPMHLFTRGEACRLLRDAGFVIREVQPISLVGPLQSSWWLPSMRAYGYLIAARNCD